MSTIIAGPFNRVEGDLEVKLDVADGKVASAQVTAPLYRGFEALLQGRPALDALVLAPRICGICSVSQSVASAFALAEAGGIAMPDNGRLAANLMLAAENAADHLTHFYLFFLPDFARAAYAGRPWFAEAEARFKAQSGAAVGPAVRARTAFLHVMGLLAGKWPHSLALQPGGTAKTVDLGEKVRLTGKLAEFREFLEAQVYGDCLEAVAALDSVAGLEAWAAEGQGDFRLFLRIAADLDLSALGRGQGRFLSYGSFPDGSGGRTFRSGAWVDGAVAPVDAAAVAEDLTHAWMSGPTQPDADKADAYSWCKAPRLSGKPMEVGALARQLIAGHPLAADLVRREGANARSRVAGRLLELARLVMLMESWVAAIRPGQPFHASHAPVMAGAGAGLIEAARGSLGHWLIVEDGVIARYQIIAPTTWNFSPRDAAAVPGPLEAALVGTPVTEGETTPLAVQHVVRSFDPCMACTVH